MPEAFAPHHSLEVRKTLGSLHLDANLVLSAPWTLVYGPSGSGKSSLLHAMCGFLGSKGITFIRLGKPHEIHDLIGDGKATPSHLLGLSYAPQAPTLFPHLRTLENITFGSTSRGINTPANSTITELSDIFELQSLLLRRPHELSGGERQRVSLARAFAVPEARLMLLDEPFSGIDRAMRDRILPRMQRFLTQRGLPVLSVSHDVDEALLLEAEVIRLRAGKVVAQGPARQVLAEERERMIRALGAA